MVSSVYDSLVAAQNGQEEERVSAYVYSKMCEGWAIYRLCTSNLGRDLGNVDVS